MESNKLDMGFSRDNLKGFILALLSSGFIGASFIIKKKGLRRAAAASGLRAGEVSLIFYYFLFSKTKFHIFLCGFFNLSIVFFFFHI